MSQPTLSAAVAGTWSTLSETAHMVEESSAFGLADVVDLDRGDDRAWQGLVASPGLDLVVLDAAGDDRPELVRQLHGAGKAVLLTEPFPMTAGELEELIRLQAAGGRPIGVLAPHRALLHGAETASPATPFAYGVLEVSDCRPVEAHRWARWAPLTRNPETQAALRAVAFHLDLACQLLGAPETVCVSGFDDGTGVGIVNFARGCRFVFAVTSRSANRVERLDLLGAGSRIRVADGRVSLEQDFVVRTAELPSLISARELLLHEMADAIRTVGRLRYGSLAAGRGLAKILGELGK
ncbi:hypothetical protein [Streptomyces sp. NPDC102283]|uniref:hypothetical protein n=1 Tax=Streptomyces sp. NPDC102283 TaxID=3366155 RepID=UPI0037F45A70